MAHLLSKHYNARLILEEFADNPFLPKFYENPGLYAFPLELFFMAERYKQLKDLIQQKDLFQNLTISDYLFTKCLLFAKVNLPEDEFRLYQRLFDIIQQQVILPDLAAGCSLVDSPFGFVSSGIANRMPGYRSAELGTPYNAEVERLRKLSAIASLEGVRVGLLTEAGRMTQDPANASVLCDNVKGLRPFGKFLGD